MSDASLSPRSGPPVPTAANQREAFGSGKAKLEARKFSFYYGSFQALRDVRPAHRECSITAIIGPSGCGKSTFLRAINRMHDQTPGARGGARSYSMGRISTRPAPTRCCCAGGLAWCSSGQTRLPSRSSIMSRMACASCGRLNRSQLAEQVEHALPGRAVGRSERQTRPIGA
ncbi:MAG: ATP-binding cassette domain-containing protein [Kouleothrix sp.]